MTLYAYPWPRRMARPWVAAGHLLPVNVRDEDEAFILTALVPGLRADDLTIQVIQSLVQIEGEFKPDESERSQSLLRELPAGPFRRSLQLPAPVQAEQVEARIADGVLTLRLPKAESARPKTIKAASK
jgi:HSP20 family protein